MNNHKRYKHISFDEESEWEMICAQTFVQPQHPLLTAIVILFTRSF